MITRLLIAVAMLCAVSEAQVSVAPLLNPHQTFVDQSGSPCAGCTLSSFTAGTTIAQPTYTDASGLVQNQNPIVLSVQGGANIWVDKSLSYKFVLKSALGATIWTVDNISGLENDIVSNPFSSQTITQPAGTDFNCNTSAGGRCLYNGQEIATNAVELSSTGSQNINQTFPSSLNATAVNGTFNEEFFPGADVNHRIAASMAACGATYSFICTIIIPPYAPIDQTTMPIPTSTVNNVTIIDQRGVNGQGIFQGSDIPIGGCTPFQVNCPNAALPGLRGNQNWTYRVGDNDASDSINTPTQSTVLGCSITTNVATCTTSNPNSFIIGESVMVSNMANLTYLNNAALNSFYTVLAAGLTSTQFSFNFTHADVPFTSDSGIAGVLCTFCGRNGFNLTGFADSGITHTNGSDGSLQTATIGVFRAAASARQVTALNLTAQCFMNHPNNFANDFCGGLQINMTNRDATDPFGNQAGVFLTAGGGTVGRAIQTTGSGVGGGFDIIGLFQGYKSYGLYLNGLTGRTADIHIVPLLDDGSHEIEGQNAANTATTWDIDSNGAANFPIVNATQQLTSGTVAQFNGSIINGTAYQRTAGVLGCTTAATVGATCTTGALAWAIAFPDTNYQLMCSLNGPTGVPVISSVSRGTTTFTITIAALTVAAATANYQCIAIHN